MTHLIDYEKWMNQPLIWGKRTRGRGLVYISLTITDPATAGGTELET